MIYLITDWERAGSARTAEKESFAFEVTTAES